MSLQCELLKGVDYKMNLNNVLVNEDGFHAKCSGNGTGVLTASTTKTRQNVARSVMTSCLQTTHIQHFNTPQVNSNLNYGMHQNLSLSAKISFN